ncbi:MAG: hypothetical protein ABIN01_17240 [Ferruginibacter sp.]
MKPFIVYLIKFIGAFCMLYFGTKAVIGLTVPGNYYNGFIAGHLNYPALLRNALLQGTRLLAILFGFDAFIRDAYHVAVVNGRAVRLVYACLGYGLLSFWSAFIFANNGSFLKKLKWIIAGCAVIWFINVIRITLVLIAANQHWKFPMAMEQHTLYNVIAYASIFFMIWLFHQSEKPPSPKGEFFE